ncbi:PIN domain-containing protein [Nocardioides sp. HDW12B]|uniref:PIN domain-containing protein n=1 Tax=Nocardioides sp. HDW12B TaxID=2714939 RepID=UPI00140E2053|nr:PIN domain-containing protein [Nocardioides sp. HDW12B]QIK66019.1 PIN domain-containing protein [Nocardioides sp. HDW12B]
MFAAILDTCVLWPSLQRDFLLSMAIEGLYRPLWSEAILEELHRHEQAKLIEREHASEDQALAAADRLVGSMRSAFDDALVIGWEPLEGTFGLPDVDDEHVVAAAVVGGAGAIVTDNLKHFPVDRVPRDIQVLSAVEFASNTADVNPEHAANAIREISRRHQNPPHTPHEILDLLVHRYGMTDVAELVSPLLDG